MWASWAALLAALAVPAAVLLLAVWALIAGWRGKRVGTDPFCARCDYSLVGLPETSGQCPECGQSLTAPNAVALGVRRRHRWLVLGSGVVLAGFAVLIGLGLRYVWVNVNLAPYKPTAWLVEDLADPSMRLRQAAIVEFRHRTPLPGTSAHTVPASPARLLAAADRVLRWQTDRAHPWYVEQGDFIERLRQARILDDDRYRTYLTNGIDFTIQTRDDYRLGDPLAVRLGTVPRLSSGTGPIGRWSLRLQVKTPDGLVPLASSSGTASTSLAGGSGYISLSLSPDRELLQSIPLGAHEVDVEIITHVFEHLPNRNFPTEGDTPFLTLTRTRSVKVKFLPEYAQNIALVARPGLDSELQDALSAPTVNFRRVRERLQIDLRFRVNSPPEGVAMSCYVVDGDRELRIGGFACPPHTTMTYGIGNSFDPDPWGDDWPRTVSVVFRPEADVARLSTDVHRIANVALRWDNVPVIGLNLPTTLTTRHYYSPP